MNIAEMLLTQVGARPDALAIVEGSGRKSVAITFRELEERSAGYAGVLARSGLKPGDPVLVLQPVSIALYVVMLALFRLGLVAVFLETSAGKSHMERCCELILPRALIGSPSALLLAAITAVLRRIPLKFSAGIRWPGSKALRGVSGRGVEVSLCACDERTPALITFTSGSTGEPRAVLRTHGFLAAQQKVIAETLGLEPGVVDMPAMPVFVLANIAAGVTSVLPDADLRYPGRIKAGPVMAQVKQFAPRALVASPAFLERIADYFEAGSLKGTGWKKIFTGGAPVFPDLMERINLFMPNAQLTAVYGSTEAEPMASVEWKAVSEDDRRAMEAGRGLLAGLPVPSIRLAIMKDQWGSRLGSLDVARFQSLVTRVDESGEIVVSGPHVLGGYLHGKGDEETKFEVDGVHWHRTGDAGYLDKRGRLWLLGRCAARIKDQKGELYPFQVECAARQIQGVRRVALSLYGGMRVLAVEPAPTGHLAEPDVMAHALAWAHLDRVIIVKRIPMDRRHNSKVDYPALKVLLGRAL